MANFNCPHCNSTLDIPDNLAGQQVACPICSKAFTVTPPQPQVAVAPQPAIPTFQKPQSSGSAAAAAMNSGALLLALLAAVAAGAALIMQLFFCPVPKLSFEKDPADALKALLECRVKGDALGSYFWRNEGGKILDTLEVVETKTSGDFAAVYWKVSSGASTHKQVTFFKRNKDGYYIPCNEYSDDMDKDFLKKHSESISKFEKDSTDWRKLEK